MNFYQFIIPRLNGIDIEKDFDHYIGLVKKGIAGFIIFGGKLDTVRKGIKEFQREAKKPLIIASDLEQGLRQQIEGGTLFPPAMAIANAIALNQKSKIKNQKSRMLRNTFKAIALEARYAGINTIFAPVLDINTNPRNPIISTRAFGDDAETVSFFGCEMVKTFQSRGIAACGKHFPGHGDTEIDSHIKLPFIKKDLKSLEKTELVPFRNAIRQGVKMIMLGHLKVPALDSSGIPVSLSEKAVRYLRDKMRFKGVIITDALNMGGIGKYTEEKASLIALQAGVDLLLHPTDPDRIVSYLEKKVSGIRCQVSKNQLWKKKTASRSDPDFENHRRLSEELTRKAIKISGQIRPMKKPLLIILDDENEEGAKRRGEAFAGKFKEKFPDLRLNVTNYGSEIQNISYPDDIFIIVAIFSKIKAWKGGPSPWLLRCIRKLENKAEIFISFGSPYILDGVRDDITKVYAFWDSEVAQRAVAEVI